MKSRIYVAMSPDYRREVVRLTDQGLREAPAKYVSLTGPFPTMRGANFMASQVNNPHCRSVADAERIANAQL